MIDCSETENYLKERNRMCKRFLKECEDCSDCSFYNHYGCERLDLERTEPEKAIEIVQKWSDEHPQNTILMDFVKKYPNAPLEENGTPRFCPYHLGYMTKEDFDDCSHYCKQCWNTSIESEEK